MPTYLEQTGAEVQEILNRPEIKRNSQLINDEGYINREEDPTVPSWSKQPNKPTYTAEEVGAMPSDAAFKTINGESVKGTGNINTDAIRIQNSPRLVATGDVFDEYFGASAYDLLDRGICGYADGEESYSFIYYKVSGRFSLEDYGIGPTVIFDDGTTRSTITTRDEDGTIYIESLSEESSKVELQQSLTPGSSTKAPSVNAVKNRIEPIEAKIPAEASSSNKLADKAYVDGRVAIVDEKVGDIEDLIPVQATPLNKLADKAFVNSSVQTATANFRGAWGSLDEVPSSASDYPSDYAGSHTPTVNDYLVVQDVSYRSWVEGLTYYKNDVNEYDGALYICIKDHDSVTTPPSQDTVNWKFWVDLTHVTGDFTGTWRFKYTGSWTVNGKSGWQPEYQVNETPLTAAQLAALNSGITSSKVTKLNALPTNAELQQSLEDLTPLVLTYGTSYGEETYNALEAIATGTTNRKAFIKKGNNVYPASVEDYGAVYPVQAVELSEPDLSGIYKLCCVIAPDGADGYDTQWSRANAETQEVFVATYNTTTYEDIRAAYEAGKLPIVIRNNNVYVLTAGDLASAAYFTSSTGLETHRIRCTTTNVWGIDTVSLENRLRKVTGVPTAADLQSTDKYPSMKTAADYINSQLQGALDESYPRAIAQINALYPED